MKLLSLPAAITILRTTMDVRSDAQKSTPAMELADYSDIKGNDQYACLQRTFLASGKGRRPNLPSDLVVNNLLLVQLFTLREESSASWKKLESWFKQIRPEVSQTRIRPMILKAVSSFRSLSASDCPSFLQQQLDFDFISSSLSALGITRATVSHPPLDMSGLFSSVCNRFVIDFHKFCIADNMSKDLLYKWLGAIYKASQVEIVNSVSKTMKDYDKELKRKNRHPDEFDSFMSNVFKIINPKEQNSFQFQPKPSNKVKIAAQTISGSECDRLREEIVVLKDMLSQIKRTKANGDQIASDLKSKNDRLLREIESAKSKFQEQKVKHEFKLKENIEEMKMKYSVRCLNLKARLREERSYQDDLKSFVSALTEENERLKLQLLTKNKTIRNLKKEISVLQRNNQEFLSQLQNKENERNSIDLKEPTKNAYSDNIRQVTIGLQSEAGVAAGNVHKAIQIVSEGLFDHKIEGSMLPCKQTAINMLSEGYVVSNLQVVEKVMESSNITLHSDGTSRDQKKIVNHQLTLDDGVTYFLGFKPVASEDSNTLLEITINVLKKLSESFGDMSCKDSENILKSMLSKITSTMTDRAATMKLFDSKFEDFLKVELGSDARVHFLHCNAHFLLGLCSACEKALLNFEKETVASIGRSLGRDQHPQFKVFSNSSESATKRVIRTVCEILGPRGDQKNGCRSEWTTFCEKSLIPSFKNNRFNCFFEAASTIVFHCQKIRQFFMSGVLGSERNLKIQSVSLDMQDEILMSFVCAVSLLFVKVTGPYWKIVTSQVPYSDFPRLVQLMVGSFEKWCEDPSDCLENLSSSVFGTDWCIDSSALPALGEFIKTCDSSLLEDIIKSISEEFKIVAERQLKDFLVGGKLAFELSGSLPESLKHCPLTNLVGESAFGDFDYDMFKRRNSSLHNRSALHVVKRNKTLSFIKSKSQNQRSKLFKIARRQAPKLKREDCNVEEEVKNATRQKFVLNQEKQIQKQMQSLSRNSELLNKVQKYGGPCTSTIDVDNLLDKLRSEKKSKTVILEAVKNEIRYWKLVKNVKSLKMGPLNDMIESLKQSLESENVSSPPSKRIRIDN